MYISSGGRWVRCGTAHVVGHSGCNGLWAVAWACTFHRADRGCCVGTDIASHAHLVIVRTHISPGGWGHSVGAHMSSGTAAALHCGHANFGRVKTYISSGGRGVWWPVLGMHISSG